MNVKDNPSKTSFLARAFLRQKIIMIFWVDFASLPKSLIQYFVEMHSKKLKIDKCLQAMAHISHTFYIRYELWHRSQSELIDGPLFYCSMFICIFSKLQKEKKKEKKKKEK